MPDFITDNHLFHNPVEFVMSKIGGTYKMPILWRIKDKNWRFSELKKSLPHASDRMLAKALKELVEDAFISKKIFAEVPVRVEYAIEPRGLKAVEIIDVLRKYGLELLEDFEINH
uniref:winged helix-turn-helix transcriptional regulator n=1 Tax=Flavobacterium sp. TaxID=239 RepID=UPI00404A737B